MVRNHNTVVPGLHIHLNDLFRLYPPAAADGAGVAVKLIFVFHNRTFFALLYAYYKPCAPCRQSCRLYKNKGICYTFFNYFGKKKG